MNGTTRSQPVVRPRFLKWSSLALVAIVPLAVHAIWGYVEARRLTSAIAAIEARGEPTYRSTELPVGDRARAERYYHAAAALASRFESDLPMAFVAAGQSGDWSPDLAAKLANYLLDYRTALQLLDSAAPLPFVRTGFSRYIGGDMMSAVRLGYLRAMQRAVVEDGDAAAAALYSAIRAGRYFDGDLGQYLYATWAVLAARTVLERTRPTEALLSRVAEALAAADRDDILRAQFLALRMDLLETRPAEPLHIGSRERPILIVNRPLRTHHLVAQLDALERLIDAVQVPWPERLDAVASVGARALSGSAFGPAVVDRSRLDAVAVTAARQLAMNRALRIVVAVERFRRDHDERLPTDIGDLVPTYLDTLLVDPFTGKPLQFAKEEGGYVAYSLGPNRRDDGGDVVASSKNGERSAADTGIRIRYVR